VFRQQPDVPRFHPRSAAGVVESRLHCAARRLPFRKKTPFLNSPKRFRSTVALYCCSSYSMHVHWLLLPVASRLDNLELLQSLGPRLVPLHACTLRLRRILITCASSPLNNALEKLVTSSCTLLQQWVGTSSHMCLAILRQFSRHPSRTQFVNSEPLNDRDSRSMWQTEVLFLFLYSHFLCCRKRRFAHVSYRLMCFPLRICHFSHIVRTDSFGSKVCTLFCHTLPIHHIVPVNFGQLTVNCGCRHFLVLKIRITARTSCLDHCVHRRLRITALKPKKTSCNIICLLNLLQDRRSCNP
jgi:hypothetical protein